MSRLLRAVTALVFLTSVAVAKAEEFYHPADCWLLDISPYAGQTNFRGVLDLRDVQGYMQSLALQYTVPIEVIAGIAFQESGVRQWEILPNNAPGFLVHNLNECRTAFQTGQISPGLPPPPGLGLMQLTSITASDPSIPNHDILQQITNWRYNLEAGVQVLVQKYAVVTAQAPACVANVLSQTANRKLLENWYYAIQFYNGGPQQNDYRDSVYGHIATPEDRIQGVFPAVTITRPESGIPGFVAGQYFAVDTSGTWTDANCATHSLSAGTVHPSSSYAIPFPRQLGNISTRLNAGTGDNVPIGGFIVLGSALKKIMVRGIGPSLPVPGAMADPVLELHESTTGQTLATNDDWGNAENRQEIMESGIAPTNAKESAILKTLPSTPCTAILKGAGNTTGVGLVEVYDMNTHADIKLVNLSTRGFVQTGDNVMIGGVIIVGQGSQEVLIRAMGPSLPLPNFLMDPMLELHNSDGALIASNDNWKDTQQAAIQATGIPPNFDEESAILMTLTPAPYTAIVRGKNNTSGLALVEFYPLN
jgi:hypothetical protein